MKNCSKDRFCPLERMRDVLETSKYDFWYLCFTMKNCSRNRFCPLQRVRDVLETCKYHFWDPCFTMKNCSRNRFCPLQRVTDVLETSKYHFWSLCFKMENCTRNRLCSLQCVRGVVDTSKYHFRGFCFTTKNISGILCLLYNAFATRYSLLHSHFGSLDALISPMTDIMSNLAHKFNLFDYSFFDCISSYFRKFDLQKFLL